MKQSFKKILMVDNFDSFTYNLVEYFKIQGCEVTVYRNTVSPSDIEKEDFDLMVLSPGPSTPSNAGNLMQIIERFHTKVPIFGVCLGHQALIEFFGGTLKYLEPKHGKADEIICDQQSIYTGLDTNIQIARYHSLAADDLPNVLDVSARSASDGTIMSMRHKTLPIEGVQYHPESVLAMKGGVGMKIIENVVNGKINAGNVGYQQLMTKLQSSNQLSIADIELFLKNISEEQLSEDQKLILLVSFSFKLNNANSLKDFITVLQQYANINEPQFADLGIDICGTGGSGLPRINTSTLAAVLLSSLEVPILKHGNKAASGRFGSFDLLEALDVPFNFNTEQHIAALKEKHLAFVFAPHAHPVVRHFGSSRAKMGVPTIFNVIGPLLNPYHPKRQLIGTTFNEYMELILEAGIAMGKEQLIVVRGGEGLDEVSVTKPTRVLSYINCQKKEYTIQPSDFGIEPVDFELLKSDNPKQSIEIATKIIDGKLDTEHYKLVAANAAFAYCQFKESISLKEAFEKMVTHLKTGALRKQLEHYKSSKFNVSEM
jgi:anthranilate phosphoribosyltransferase